MTPMKHLAYVCICCFICAVRPASGAPNGGPAEHAAEARTERAREHYSRGLERYDAKAYVDALTEFQRAYALQPNYQLLFNLGQLQFLLGHHAKARQSLSRYLDEGGTHVPSQRREEVSRQLAALARRTAELALEVDLDGALVEVQGESIGRSPLAGHVIVETGNVNIRASKAGQGSLERTVQVAGNQVVRVRLEFRRAVPSPDRSSINNPAAVAGWLSTGVLGLGAVGTGVATLLTSRRYEELRGVPAAPDSAASTRERLDRQRERVKDLSTVTDVLAVATLATAALSLYLTLDSGSRGEPVEQISIELTPVGMLATGRF